MISIKKIAVVGASAGLVLGAVAVPAFAHGFGGQVNFAGITNTVSASSNTGSNHVGGELENKSTTATGNATTGVEVDNLANANLNVSTCGCKTSQFNGALVGNTVGASANTGSNTVGGEVEGGSSTKTGNASTGVLVTNVVNKNVSFGFGGIN